MALYEHVFISRQDISTAQAESLVDHFGNVLKENGGELVGHEYWGLKTMAYKINKNRKGHYVFLKTNSNPEAVHEMERLMRLHEDVMRVLTIKVKQHDANPSVMLQSKSKNEDRSTKKLRHEY